PVNSVRLSGKNATDHTGRPGPTKVCVTVRVARATIATEPRIPAAATRVPSGDIASAITGVGDACRLPSTSPAGDRKYNFPSAPPVTISPSRATATAFNGDGSVTMFAAPPASG